MKMKDPNLTNYVKVPAALLRIQIGSGSKWIHSFGFQKIQENAQKKKNNNSYFKKLDVLFEDLLYGGL
jgi:hypothetical protein